MHRLQITAVCLALSFLASACASGEASNTEFFGKVQPPAENTLRYISGSEPESLDPQVSTGQPEGRVYMALFEGLVEYDPKTMEPIPSIAERWVPNNSLSEFVFYIRKNARWSNGDPITAHDFVYSFRRGLAPEFAARNAPLAYYIKYAQAYNEKAVFVRDPQTGQFLLEKDVKGGDTATNENAAPVATNAAPAPAKTETAASAKNTTTAGEHPENVGGVSEFPPDATDATRDSDFHHYIHSPSRLVLNGDEKKRAKEIEADPKLKAAVAGKEFVTIRGEDIGVEAVDDYTFRVTLSQSAPYFVGMMGHQFFRLVPRKAIEKHGNTNWTQPQNIITCGPFKLESWKPYNEIVVVRDPMNWDAANVKLDRIIFPAVEDTTTMMNLYKAGEADTVANHNVPIGWLDRIRPLKDYMDAPEAAIQYYQINVKKPPMDDKRVRKAFNMAIDKNALAQWRRVVKPLTAFTPEGLFPGYPQPKGDPFDPAAAKKLLADAGYKDASGNFDPKKFPVEQVKLVYNTKEENKQVAEFLQAQWKQNLGLTIPLNNMEWKTFLKHRSGLEYVGFARGAWVGDYMDPFTFLNLFYTEKNDSGTGWHDPKFDAMINQANSTLDPQKRYELLAKAEAYMLDAQPIIPLYTNATNFLKKPYVKGLYPNAGTMHAWKYVYIERDPAKWDRGVPDMSKSILAE
jgi:oligopeptide transport system substrate-binding protein